MAKIKITITELKCKECGHIWFPRRKNEPKVCPKCKSAWWDKKKNEKST